MTEITLNAITKRFDQIAVVNQISLKIEPGELFFLLGPSGCGKTTLLRMIAGFCQPDSGSICFGSDEVTHLAPHKRNTGMVFQSYALWPHLSVAQNVAFGLEEQKRPEAEIRQRVAEALEAVRMSAYAQRKPNTLSGGQQQRVALARALVVRPRCLLLDEPLSNLDAQLRAEMRGEIRRICKSHQLTSLYVTHDQKEALCLADRIAVLNEGRLIQVGTPQELYKRPINRFVASFVGETNLIQGSVERVEAGSAVVRTELGTFVGVTIPGHEPIEGGRAFLSLRPECLHLDEFAPEENVLQGQISERLYFGESAQYVFSTEKQSLRISELNPRHLNRTQKLHAWIDPEDLIVLKE